MTKFGLVNFNNYGINIFIYKENAKRMEWLKKKKTGENLKTVDQQKNRTA